MEEIIAMVEQASELVRQVMESLSDREVVLALASDSDLTYDLEPKLTLLVGAGTAMGSRLDQIRRLARELDALTDPATITEVR